MRFLSRQLGGTHKISEGAPRIPSCTPANGQLLSRSCDESCFKVFFPSTKHVLPDFACLTQEKMGSSDAGGPQRRAGTVNERERGRAHRKEGKEAAEADQSPAEPKTAEERS